MVPKFDHVWGTDKIELLYGQDWATGFGLRWLFQGCCPFDVSSWPSCFLWGWCERWPDTAVYHTGWCPFQSISSNSSCEKEGKETGTEETQSRERKEGKGVDWRNALVTYWVLTEIPLAMAHCTVNFMCQLQWTMGCPDVWLNIVLSVSDSWIGTLSQADCPPQCGGLIQSVETKEQKNGGPTHTGEDSCLTASGQRTQCSFASRLTETSALPGSPACRLKILKLVSLHHHVTHFLRINPFICIPPIGSVLKNPD